LPITYEVKPELSVYPPTVTLPSAGRNVFARVLLRSELADRPVAVDTVSISGLTGLTTRCTRVDDLNSFVYVSGEYEWVDASRHAIVITFRDRSSIEVPVVRNSALLVNEGIPTSRER
jgi:hypothetical protein